MHNHNSRNIALIGALASFAPDIVPTLDITEITKRRGGRSSRSKYLPHVGIKQQRKAEARANRNLNAA